MMGETDLKNPAMTQLDMYIERNLSEDIELLPGDISAEDCFTAALTGKVFDDLFTPEENEAWKEL